MNKPRNKHETQKCWRTTSPKLSLKFAFFFFKRDIRRQNDAIKRPLHPIVDKTGQIYTRICRPLVANFNACLVKLIFFLFFSSAKFK